ncbi:MAG: type II toxin-antitoxin system PemK/MazF family toxin [Chloroflexi bacterium]|nr:type II toxin-antitoxin system PemK/MazF family toxin [Chloroflexota bacterium]
MSDRRRPLYAKIEGSEQAGTRPAVIVSRDAISRYSPVVVICPLTSASNVPRLYPSDVLVRAPEDDLKNDSVVLTLQVRAVAKTRLGEWLGKLEPATVQAVAQAMRITLDI